jgi:hypothetical protein
MNRKLAVALIFGLLVGGDAVWAGIAIRTEPEAPPLLRLGAKELSRYLYLRTGTLPGKIDQDGRIVVATKASALLDDAAVRAAAHALGAQQYLLATTSAKGMNTWWIVGGDEIGTLYGAYRFCERLGMRFYLHGDVAPDEWLTSIPSIDETGKPLFTLRGVNPWGSHPHGFDAWDLPLVLPNDIGSNCDVDHRVIRKLMSGAWKNTATRRFDWTGIAEVSVWKDKAPVAGRET